MQNCAVKAKTLLEKGWKKVLLCLILAVIAAVCLEWLQVKTWSVDPRQPNEGMFKKNIVILSAVLFILFLILNKIHAWKRLVGCLQRAKEGITEDRKYTLKCVLLFLLVGGLTYLLLWLYIPYILEKPFNRMMNILVLAVSIAVGCGFCFRRTLGRKPEVFFLIICILMGSTIAIMEPAKMLSWDEPIHYRRAIDYSYLGETRLTEEDLHFVDGTGEDTTDALSEQDEWHAAQDELYRQGLASRPVTKIDLKSFWPVFSGIGLYIGRVLGCSYYQIMALGRLFNAVAYAIIGYFAIRRLKYGKMLLAAVLMIPECVFLASNYSYDPGVTVFIALGLSYCFAEWQEPGQKMKWQNALIMTVSLFLGCIAKTIYFPILLLPLFMKREKFSNRREPRCYIILILAAMLLLILSFTVPFVFSDGTGDTRGGDDVNAFGQVHFILQNPLRYADILYRFFRQYLDPFMLHSFVTHFAYLGISPEWVIYLILLGVLAFTDKDGTDYGIPGIRISRWVMMAILCGIMVLVATSMYIAFTPVGLDTVNGCQPRYMLPLFFPGLMLIGSQKMVNRMNKTLYNGLAFAVMGYAGFSSILLMIVNIYH